MKIKGLLFAFCLLLTSCSMVTIQAADIAPTAPPTAEPSMDTIPNPASVYCEQQGYKSEIRTAPDGSQSGVCIFPDGSECDEWAYYRGECDLSIAASDSSTPSPDNQGWMVYTNDSLGYSFEYPAGAQITTNDDPLKSLYVSGSGMGTESWTIAHPNDREEYRPPADADLVQWLTDHYLMGENRQPDLQIAGTAAIHFRHEASPQSYAFDQYYFAKNGQLYQVTLGHSGSTEDVVLNDSFLQSFQFTVITSDAAIQTPIPTAVPIEASYYQGFWTYTNPAYGFSIMLPEDWVVDETTTFDPVMNDHVLIFHLRQAPDVHPEIRMSFRSVGEDAMLWPTGVGQGEFIAGGTLDVAGAPVTRTYLVCPAGQINSIWYQGGENQPNIQRGNMEFGFIYSYSGTYCSGENSLTGKVQLVGEMIIASLQVP
jgi:putative hemolysin